MKILTQGTSKPKHDQIAKRAYELWEQRGRPTGCDAEIWLKAEQELISPSAKRPPLWHLPLAPTTKAGRSVSRAR